MTIDPDFSGRLSRYLSRVAARPFQWGELDCALFAAGWAMQMTGIDPAADWRGKYSTEQGCARILKRHGGLLTLAANGAQRAGLISTETPSIGAIGVLEVETARGRDLALAIYVGSFWSLLSPDGLLMVRADPVAAWEV